MSSKNKQSTSLSNVEKGNKNNFYLKQHLNQNRGKSYTSKDRQGVHQEGDGSNAQSQHRKNHSVVVQRGDVLKYNVAKQQIAKQNTVLGVPSDISPSRVERIDSRGVSTKGLKLPQTSNSLSDVHNGHYNSAHGNNQGQEGRISSQSDYVKSSHQYGTSGKTRVTKGSSSSIDRLGKTGAMTPSI